jgi:bacterioferritin (cytochrome b1)
MTAYLVPTIKKADEYADEYADEAAADPSILEPKSEVPAEPEPPPEPLEPTASAGTHPLAIAPQEGFPGLAQPDLLKKLQKVLELKYTGILAYTHYADRIRAPFRDSIADHFKEHAKEERRGAYDYALKMTALGGEPEARIGKIPNVSGIKQICMALMTAELGLLDAERELVDLSGDYTGFRLMVEEHLRLDQAHLDDLRRLFITVE